LRQKENVGEKQRNIIKEFNLVTSQEKRESTRNDFTIHRLNCSLNLSSDRERRRRKRERNERAKEEERERERERKREREKIKKSSTTT